MADRGRPDPAAPPRSESHERQSASAVIPGPLAAALIAAVVAVAVAAVHWPVLSAQATSFDDDLYVTGNALVQDPGWTSLSRFFGEILNPSSVRGYYQPLTMTSLMLDWALGGRADDLSAFHRTSLALHMANSVLVAWCAFFLLRRQGGGDAVVVIAAATGGLLFGLHPLNVDAVAWVSERKTPLAAFFALLSVLGYVLAARSGLRRHLAWSLVAFAGALLAKPTATTLPVLLLLLNLWPLRRWGRGVVLETIPYFVIAAVSTYITTRSQSTAADVVLAGDRTASDAVLLFCSNLAFYFQKFIVPTGLSIASARPYPLSLENPAVRSGVAGFALVAVSAAISLRWSRAWAVGVAFFTAAILPALGIIEFTWMNTAAKYAYLPMVGLVLPLAAAVMAIGRRVSAAGGLVLKGPAAVAAVCLLGILSVEAIGTRRRIAEWRDRATLFESMVRIQPENGAALNELAGVRFHEGRIDEAEALYRRAIEAAPANSFARVNLGIFLAQAGRFDEAWPWFHSGIEIRPREPAFRRQFGSALVRAGLREDAVAQYLEAVRLAPEFDDARLELANVLADISRFHEAAEHLRELLGRRPDRAPAWNSLGTVLKSIGDLPAAVECFQRAVELDPGYSSAWMNLGNAAVTRNETNLAIAHYERAVAADAANPLARAKLGVCMVRAGRHAEAVVQLGVVLALDPGFVEGWHNLGLAHEALGNQQAADDAFRHVLRLRPDHADARLRLERRSPSPP